MSWSVSRAFRRFRRSRSLLWSSWKPGCIGRATTSRRTERACRARLDAIFGEFEVLPLGPVEAAAYARIVERCGYSRRRIIDRLIAATAIVADATLITMNGADFRDIPGLKLEVWPAP